MEYSTYHRKLMQLKNLSTYGLGFITLLGVIHCLLLFFGYDIYWLHLTACLFIYFIGIGISRMFDLCWIHKACVTYFCTILICITMKRHGIIDAYAYGTQIARLVMAVIGTILTTLLIWKVKSKKNY